MYLRYGSYTHAQHEAAITIVTDVTRDEFDLPLRATERWSIRGELHGDDQTALLAAMAALEAAYSEDGNDITLLCDDASTVAHRIVSSDTDTGVMVTRRPSYPIGVGAELSTYRTYEIQVEASYDVREDNGAILSYTETLRFSGGGPRHVLHELRNGVPQLQQVSQATVYTATQSGEALGFNDYVTAPPPYWGAPIFDQPNSSVAYGTPKRKGNGRDVVFREYPTSWTYQFQSASPLVGRPRRSL